MSLRPIVSHGDGFGGGRWLRRCYTNYTYEETSIDLDMEEVGYAITSGCEWPAGEAQYNEHQHTTTMTYHVRS